MGKKIHAVIFVLILIFVGLVGIRIMAKKNVKEVEVAVQENSTENKNEPEVKESVINKKLEINTVTFDKMREKKINSKTAKSIIDYRDKFGCIRDISELSKIKGIGLKTCEKLKEIFIIDQELAQSIPLKTININTNADRETLFMLGFTKKEADKIEKWKNDKGSIFSNTELLNIIGDEKYQLVRERIRYSEP